MDHRKRSKRRYVSGSSPTSKSPTKRLATQYDPQANPACNVCSDGRCFCHDPANTDSPLKLRADAQSASLMAKLMVLPSPKSPTDYRTAEKLLVPPCENEDPKAKHLCRNSVPKIDTITGGLVNTQPFTATSPRFLAHQTHNFLSSQYKRQATEYAQFIHEMQAIVNLQHNRIVDLEYHGRENERFIHDLQKTVVWQMSKISKLERTMRRGSRSTELRSKFHPGIEDQIIVEDTSIRPEDIPITPELRPARATKSPIPGIALSSPLLDLTAATEPVMIRSLGLRPRDLSPDGSTLPLRPKALSSSEHAIDEDDANAKAQEQPDPNDGNDTESDYLFDISEAVSAHDHIEEEVERKKDRLRSLTSHNANNAPYTPSSTSILPIFSEPEYTYETLTNPCAALLASTSSGGIRPHVASPCHDEGSAPAEPVTYASQLAPRSLNAIARRQSFIEDQIELAECQHSWRPGPSSRDGVRMVPGRTANLLVDELGWGSRVVS